MAAIVFNFADPTVSQEFTMGKAAKNPSNNPANVTGPCIYVIYNDNYLQKTIYVGYAANANHRWSTRTEAFHVFGIDHQYAKGIKCAWCYPRISLVANPNLNNLAHWGLMNNAYLQGQNNAEHLLIRLMMGGLFGQLTITNTQLRNTQFDRTQSFAALTDVYVYFGNKFNFAIGNSRHAPIVGNFI